VFKSRDLGALLPSAAFFALGILAVETQLLVAVAGRPEKSVDPYKSVTCARDVHYPQRG
jgi:hypothetical protein